MIFFAIGSAPRVSALWDCTCVTILRGQGQRHTRNQQKPSGIDIYGLISLNYIIKCNRTNTDSLSEHTVNTPYRIMTYTGPDRWPITATGHGLGPAE